MNQPRGCSQCPKPKSIYVCIYIHVYIPLGGVARASVRRSPAGLVVPALSVGGERWGLKGTKPPTPVWARGVCGPLWDHPSGFPVLEILAGSSEDRIPRIQRCITQRVFICWVPCMAPRESCMLDWFHAFWLSWPDTLHTNRSLTCLGNAACHSLLARQLAKQGLIFCG